MCDRLANTASSLSSEPFQYLRLQDIVPEKEKSILFKVRQFGEEHLTTNKFHQYVQKAMFPEYLLEPLRDLDVIKCFLKQPFGDETSFVGQGLIIATLAEFDVGVATFIMLQSPLVGKTIEKLGSQQQKARYLPDLVKANKIWGWALTEKNVGSDATHIETSVAKSGNNGYILNGNKRWIGNGNRDYLIVYAKNNDNGDKIEGFIVDNQQIGVRSAKIQNKLALRIVENCDIVFTDVHIPGRHHLPGATSFKKGVETMLKHTRIIVMWNVVGGCIGVYKAMLKYATTRKQFNGNFIAAYQLVQEKIVKVLSNLQAIMLCCWRITNLAEKDQITVGMIGMFKAWITERGRLICSLAREVLGGNGITHDLYVMKTLCDMEALYTYEGTYDINTLVAGHELTGVRAIR